MCDKIRSERGHCGRLCPLSLSPERVHYHEVLFMAATGEINVLHDIAEHLEPRCFLYHWDKLNQMGIRSGV